MKSQIMSLLRVIQPPFYRETGVDNRNAMDHTMLFTHELCSGLQALGEALAECLENRNGCRLVVGIKDTSSQRQTRDFLARRRLLQNIDNLPIRLS